MNLETPMLAGETPRIYSVGEREELMAEFERLALPQLSQLYASAVALTKDKSEAEDLVQGTFLLAIRFFHRFSRGTNIRAWLLAIQRNLFIGRYRQKKSESKYIDRNAIDPDHDFLMEDQSNPEKLLMFKSLTEAIEKALKCMPVEFRMAILLVDIQDLKYEEAALVLGCPVGTVRSRVYRGRRLLRGKLRDYDL